MIRDDDRAEQTGCRWSHKVERSFQPKDMRERCTGCERPRRHSPSRATTVCSVSVSFVQVIAVPGRTTRRDGVNPVSLMLILLVKTVRGSMGCGLAGGSAPSSAKTHRVSPRGKLSCQLPPEATAIYCFPLIA